MSEQNKNTPKNVQLPLKTFLGLVQYFYLDNHSEDLYNALKTDIKHKLDNLMRHEYYTEYKTTANEQDRERARQKYLDSVGMLDSFKWDAETDLQRKNC